MPAPAFAIAAWLSGVAVFPAAQSAVAIAALEMFNYVAQYGLIRERDAGGALEPFAPHHSWNRGDAGSAPLVPAVWREVTDRAIKDLRQIHA